MAEPHISPISADQIPSAASVLANAFAEAPRFRFLLPNDARLPAKLRWYWGATIRASIITGAVVHVARRESGGEVGAVAIWEPPEQGERGALTLVRSGLWAAPIRLGLSAYLRRRALGRMLSALDPPQPCWYLDTIGVEPSEQRTGLGTALLDLMLKRIDEDVLALVSGHVGAGQSWVLRAIRLPSHGGVHVTQRDSALGHDQTAASQVAQQVTRLHPRLVQARCWPWVGNRGAGPQFVSSEPVPSLQTGS